MSEREGIVLVTITNKIVPVQHAYSMNTYSQITTAHEGVTEISEQAHEWRAWVLHIAKVWSIHSHTVPIQRLNQT